MEEDGYVWQWFNNDAQIYVNYNAEHSKKIEDAYLANQLDVNLDIGRGRYTISLDVFSQYNLDSGYKRLIQRVPSVPPLTNGTAIPSYGSNIEKPYGYAKKPAYPTKTKPIETIKCNEQIASELSSVIKIFSHRDGESTDPPVEEIYVD